MWVYREFIGGYIGFYRGFIGLGFPFLGVARIRIFAFGGYIGVP